MAFLSEVDGNWLRGTIDFRLETQLIYFREKTNQKIIVPAGFITNFASIPLWARWYIDTTDPEIRDAAVVHDYLYVTKMYPRSIADSILAEAMLDLNSGKIKSTIAWLGVRVGGSIHFGQPII